MRTLLHLQLKILKVLSTRLNLLYLLSYYWAPHCLHHITEQATETLSYILNGCHAYKGMYMANHDRIVNLKGKDTFHPQ